jgi:hypothetical protein
MSRRRPEGGGTSAEGRKATVVPPSPHTLFGPIERHLEGQRWCDVAEEVLDEMTSTCCRVVTRNARKERLEKKK